MSPSTQFREPRIVWPTTRNQVRHDLFKVRNQGKHNETNRQLEQIALCNQTINTTTTQDEAIMTLPQLWNEVSDRHVRRDDQSLAQRLHHIATVSFVRVVTLANQYAHRGIAPVEICTGN